VKIYISSPWYWFWSRKFNLHFTARYFHSSFTLHFEEKCHGSRRTLSTFSSISRSLSLSLSLSEFRLGMSPRKLSHFFCLFFSLHFTSWIILRITFVLGFRSTRFLLVMLSLLFFILESDSVYLFIELKLQILRFKAWKTWWQRLAVTTAPSASISSSWFHMPAPITLAQCRNR